MCHSDHACTVLSIQWFMTEETLKDTELGGFRVSVCKLWDQWPCHSSVFTHWTGQSRTLDWSDHVKPFQFSQFSETQLRDNVYKMMLRDHVERTWRKKPQTLMLPKNPSFSHSMSSLNYLKKKYSFIVSWKATVDHPLWERRMASHKLMRQRNIKWHTIWIKMFWMTSCVLMCIFFLSNGVL